MFYISEKAKNYLNQFYENYDITDWFSMFSIGVWDCLKFYQEEDNPISKVDERELTNNLVRGISMLIKKDEIPIPVRLFHSRNESSNGSDLEIILQIKKDQNIIFPCQAKRLYVEKTNNNLNAKYEKLNYKNESGNQKQLLIEYAKRVNGFPLYLLYNYSEYDFDTSYIYPEKELYGCTLISAHYLHENPPKSPTVQNLHPPAIPLTSIVKFSNILCLDSLWGKAELGHDAKILSDKKILEDGKWYELGPPSYPPTRFVSSIDLEKILSENSSKTIVNQSFNPKFRIIFTSEMIDRYSRKINF